MAYWQCPRCGSHEVFQGTEVVAGGGGTSTVMTEHGAFTSGSTELRTKQVAVVKCKACGEILNGERDYILTPEEQEQKLKEQKTRREKWYFIILVSILIILGAVAIILEYSPLRNLGE